MHGCNAEVSGTIGTVGEQVGEQVLLPEHAMSLPCLQG
jgi:hypothetical protein